MANITAQMVKELREKTSAGMLDCNRWKYGRGCNLVKRKRNC